MQIIWFPAVDNELAKELVVSRINQAVNLSSTGAAWRWWECGTQKGDLLPLFFFILLLCLLQTIQTVIKTKGNFTQNQIFYTQAMCVQIICEFAINKILPNDVGLGNAFSYHFFFVCVFFYPARTIKNIHYNLQSKKRLRCNKKGQKYRKMFKKCQNTGKNHRKNVLAG